MNINKFVLDLTLAINTNKVQSTGSIRVDNGFTYKEIKDIHCNDEGEIIITT
jgi:hypothetical protein